MRSGGFSVSALVVINEGVLTPPAAAKAPLSKVLDLQMRI